MIPVGIFNDAGRMHRWRLTTRPTITTGDRRRGSAFVLLVGTHRTTLGRTTTGKHLVGGMTSTFNNEYGQHRFWSDGTRGVKCGGSLAGSSGGQIEFVKGLRALKSEQTR